MPGSRVCVCVLLRPGRVGRAGLPGAFRCASPFPLAALSFCSAWPPLRSGCPSLGLLFALPPPLLPFFCFSPLLFSEPPLCLLLSSVSGPGCPGPWRCDLFVLLASRFSALCALSPLLCCPHGHWLLSGGCPPHSPPLCLAVFVPAARCPVFVFFFLLFAPPLSLALSGFRPRVPWALALCFVFLFCLPLLGSLYALACFVSPAWPLAAHWWLLPPLPPLPFCVSRFSSLPLGALFFFSSSYVRPRCLWLALVSGPGCPGPSRCVLFVLWASRCPALRALSPRLCVLPCRWLLRGGCCPPPPFCVSPFPSLPLGAPFFFFVFSFFPALCAPVVSGFLWFPAPGALGLRAVRCLLCWPPASRHSVRSRLFRASWLPPGRWLLPGGCCPPTLCVSRFSSLPLGAVCRVLCCAACLWVRCCAALLRVLPPGVVLLCALLFCCARLVTPLVVPCPLALPVALGPCVLRRCVLPCSPALCALCRVCFVGCVLLFAALLCAVCVLGCCAVRSLFPPLCAVLCFAVLVRLRCAVPVVRAVAGAWCCGALLCVVLFPLVCCGAVLGLVAPGFLLVACFGVRVPVWPRGLLPCGWCGLLWCPASLCRVLWCSAVAWCCAVVLCCQCAVLLVLALPSCGHPEPWKQPVTGEPVHSPGGGRLPSGAAPQLKAQG